MSYHTVPCWREVFSISLCQESSKQQNFPLCHFVCITVLMSSTIFHNFFRVPACSSSDKFTFGLIRSSLAVQLKCVLYYFSLPTQCHGSESKTCTENDCIWDLGTHSSWLALQGTWGNSPWSTQSFMFALWISKETFRWDVEDRFWHLFREVRLEMLYCSLAML